MSDTRTYYFIYSRMQQDRIDAANKAAGLINPTFSSLWWRLLNRRITCVEPLKSIIRRSLRNGISRENLSRPTAMSMPI